MSGSESRTAVEGSGVVETLPLSVIVPVALRAWTVELPFQLSTNVPVNATAVPRTSVAETFSVKVEF
jgi:hypothetical protein